MTRFKEVSGGAVIKNMNIETDAETGTLTDSSAGNVLCDKRFKITVDGTDYWVPLFNTAP